MALLGGETLPPHDLGIVLRYPTPISVLAPEAEWLLETLEGLFDFYFVQPAELKGKRDALNKKLKEAGKPQLKSAAGKK